MAEPLSSLDDFSRDSSSAPNTGVRWFTTPITPPPETPGSSSGLLQHLHTHGTHIYEYT